MINSIHPSTLILGDPQSTVQTRSTVTKSTGAHAFTVGNVEFHEVINILARSCIHNALTISPVVSTTFVEQFWMSAKSKIINNVRFITAKVAGKPVSVSEASIRSDLLFDDADGIDSLPNQAIFDAIQLMGYEGDLTVSVTPKTSHLSAIKRIFRKSTTGEVEYVAAANCCGQVLWIQNQMLDYGFNFMNTKIYIDNESTICIVKNPVPSLGCSIADQSKVRKSLGRDKDGIEVLLLPKLFILWLAKVSTDSAKLIPLGKDSTAIETLKKIPPRHNMVDYLEKTKGNAEFHEIINFLARSSIYNALTVSPVVSTIFVEQFWMSAKSKIINNVRVLVGNHGGQSSSDKSLSGNEGDMTLQSVYDLFGEVVFLEATIDRKKSLKKHWMQKESIPTGEEICQSEPSVHKDPLFDELPEDTLDYMDTEDAQDVGRTRDVDKCSTDKTQVNTDKEKIVPISSDEAKVVSREKEKRVELKDVEETERPRPTSTRSLLTLSLLPRLIKMIREKEIEEEDESELNLRYS
ncbi:hypothetical protein Tco_0466631 [Tanacetum coccineum]